MVRTNIERSSKSGSHREFLSAETFAKNAWSLYHAGKLCHKPCTLESFHFALLKDVANTLDMQHHLIKLCIEYLISSNKC